MNIKAEQRSGKKMLRPEIVPFHPHPTQICLLLLLERVILGKILHFLYYFIFLLTCRKILKISSFVHPLKVDKL